MDLVASRDPYGRRRSSDKISREVVPRWHATQRQTQIPGLSDETDARQPRMSPSPRPVVHLELHTGDLERARAFVCELLQWREDRVDTPCGAYRALDLGAGVGGGIVECGARPALWSPYLQVEQICDRTARAVELGA